MDHVSIEFDDGSHQRVVFYDLVRLSQTFEAESRSGRPFFAEDGLIILEEVTRANMENAARRLADEGFFDHGSYVDVDHLFKKEEDG